MPPPLNNMLAGVKKHQLYLHERSKFATPYEQYVDWGNNTNFIFMRGQNSPPPLNNMLIGVKHQLYLNKGSKFATPMNNMLIGVITSTLSSSGIKIRHPYEQYVDWGNNINFIFIRDQKSPPPLNNMLAGVKKHQLYLHERSKFATPYEQYVDWGKNINFIFMRDQHSQHPMSNMLTGVITSTLSS